MYDIKYVTKRNINIFICQIILKFIIEKIWIELSKLFNIIIKKKIKLRNLYYLYLYKNIKYILILQIILYYLQLYYIIIVIQKRGVQEDLAELIN